jgi:hypothetical protein
MTADSNLVLFCLFVPFFLFGALAVVSAMAPVLAPIFVIGYQLVHYWTQPKVVYKTQTQTKTVYKDRIVYRDRPVPTPAPIKQSRKLVVKKPKKKPQPTQDKQVARDVVIGLSNLGFSKSDAKILVGKVTKNKIYNTPETLLQDCMALMSEMRT